MVGKSFYRGQRVFHKRFGRGRILCMGQPGCVKCRPSSMCVEFDKLQGGLHAGYNDCERLPLDPESRYRFEVPEALTFDNSSLDSILFGMGDET